MGNVETCTGERPSCFYQCGGSIDNDHEQKSSEDAFSTEQRNIELYIQCKQESLGIHYLPTERLRVSTQSIYTIFEDPQEVTELEFATFMGHQKLIQYNYKTDSRWESFYRFFATRIPEQGFEEPVMRDTYDFMIIMTGLICLSQSESSVKSILLAEYFTNRSFIKKRPNYSLWPRYYYPIRERADSIKSIQLSHYQRKEQDALKSIFLTKEALQTIVTVLVNLSLSLVPLLASDYARTNAGRDCYLDYVSQLAKLKQPLVQHLIDKINGGRLERNALGTVSVYRFVQMAAQLDLYETAELRKLAIVISKEKKKVPRSIIYRNNSFISISEDDFKDGEQEEQEEQTKKPPLAATESEENPFEEQKVTLESIRDQACLFKVESDEKSADAHQQPHYI